jgi:hypothetical protein
MRQHKTLSKFTALSLALVLLLGLTGNEKYVELSGYLNARASAKFRSIDDNILGVLKTGTRAEILQRKRMKSGNYGFKVEVLDGSLKGREVWVYYNMNNPDLNLYDVKPQDWEDIYTEKADPESAQGVEATRDTPAIQDPMDLTLSTKSEELVPSQEALQSTIENSSEAVTAVLKSMRPKPRPSTTAGCDSCEFRADTTNFPVEIAPATSRTALANNCHKIMQTDGSLGEIGTELYSKMSDPKYSDRYLKSDAMGQLCPNFNSLSSGQKLKAWTWFWTVLAHEESRCRPEVIHPIYATIKGKSKKINRVEGIGLWAMERYQADRSGRGEACRGDMTEPSLQVQCSIDIMAKMTLRGGSLTHKKNGNYWGPVNRYKSQLLKKMKRFKLCF